MTRASPLSERVRQLRWYHTIELPGGIVTPGEYDLRPIVSRLPLDGSLSGKRCLDVGSRDGFYAFEMERRGADEVVSLDLADPSDVDMPGGVADATAIRGELEAGHRAFETAREALGSRVTRRLQSVYELYPEEVGEFDFAVVGTLLHHLRDPIGALMAVRRVLRGHLLVNDCVVVGLHRPGTPWAKMMMRGGPFWWAVNPAGLRLIVEAAGFDVSESSRPYLIPYGPGNPKSRRRRAAGGALSSLATRVSVLRGAPHVWVLATPRAPDQASPS